MDLQFLMKCLAICRRATHKLIFPGTNRLVSRNQASKETSGLATRDYKQTARGGMNEDISDLTHQFKQWIDGVA